MGKSNVVNMSEKFNEAEKNAKQRQFEVEKQKIEEQFGVDPQLIEALVLAMNNVSGGDYGFFYKKKKPSDKVKFAQTIVENLEYLISIGYLTDAEHAFLNKLNCYLEFKSNVIVEKANFEEEIEVNSATPQYLADRFRKSRTSISMLMNGLLKKGILGVAETGMTTEDGRVCTSRTWFVNPNIICYSP
ncbi:MarR family transcriptional regulator, partial [Bacillus sp. V3B]|uniref:MarR family transcriptional regulator n=1 Tax=Bacillus sp. V3B TaxID=2804915 RepID=UPI002108CAAB